VCSVISDGSSLYVTWACLSLSLLTPHRCFLSACYRSCYTFKWTHGLLDVRNSGAWSLPWAEEWADVRWRLPWVSWVVLEHLPHTKRSRCCNDPRPWPPLTKDWVTPVILMAQLRSKQSLGEDLSLLLSCTSSLHILYINPYQIYNFPVLSIVYRLPSSPWIVSWCTGVLQFQCSSLCLCLHLPSSFWCHIQEILTKSNVIKFFPYVFS
jgi:hypothetical protein